MSKFFKKSLAVMTTAAIMASTASIVAFAATNNVTLDAGLTDKVEVKAARASSDAYSAAQALSGGAADDRDYLSFKSLTDASIILLVKIGDAEAVEVTATTDGVVTALQATAAVTVSEKKTSTGGSGVTPAGEENFDSVVWVGGKDTKASKDGKTPASLYKTETFDQVMVSAGGKWQVAVTDTSIDDVEKFAALVKDGKFDSATAKASKEYASAKIKDGTVTVTAGKKAGLVNVWVYEVKAKSIVATTVKDNAFFEKLDEDVVPQVRGFEVKVAPTMTTTAKATTLDKDGNVEAIASPEKLAKDYAAGSEVLVYFGDKKSAVSTDATFVLWDGKNKKAAETKDGVYTGTGFTAELVDATDTAGPAVKITIDKAATEKTKIDVQVKNVESGKIAKIAPKVKKAAAAAEVTKVKLTISGEVTVTAGDETLTPANGVIEVAKDTKVKFSVAVMIGETEVAANTEYTVSADVTATVKAD